MKTIFHDKIKYAPGRYTGLSIRLHKMTVLIFKSGKMVCTGGKCQDSSIATLKYVIKKAGQLGHKPTFKGNNFESSFSCGHKVLLHNLYYSIRPYAQYEPELFPAQLYRMPDPKVTAIIFHTGKCIITGSKSLIDSNRAYIRVKSILETCRQ